MPTTRNNKNLNLVQKYYNSVKNAKRRTRHTGKVSPLNPLYVRPNSVRRNSVRRKSSGNNFHESVKNLLKNLENMF